MRGLRFRHHRRFVLSAHSVLLWRPSCTHTKKAPPLFSSSDGHMGDVCWPLITDLFMEQGLGRAFLVQIDD